LKGLVIFDLDGTLLCTHRHSCKAAHETLRRLMLPDVSDETVMRLIGEPPEVFFRALAPDYPDLPALESLFDALEQEALCSVGSLYDGVPQMLAALLRDGYRLALSSNGSRDYVETALRHTGIADCFSEIACAGEFAEKTQAVAEMIRSANSVFTVVVGDGSHDAKAARENDIPFLAAGYGYGGFLAMGEAEYIANQPEEIVLMIEQIRREWLS
jgi:phosphoglycolate phosphatase